MKRPKRSRPVSVRRVALWICQCGACALLIAAFVMAVIALSRTTNGSSSSPSTIPSSVPHHVSLPTNLQETEVPNCYTLTAVDNGAITGFVFVYRSGLATNETIQQSGTCWGEIAAGAKWKTPEPYIVDPTNPNGMSSSFVFSTFEASKAKWEFCASDDIFGPRIDGTVDGPDFISPDEKNEMEFASTDSGVIAFTVTWGIFSGPIGDRLLLEHDQVYSTNFDFGDVTIDSGKMDFESIVTHEDGHSLGLVDITAGGCQLVTMYAFSSNGETHKRTLERADINGVQSLYGDSGMCGTETSPPPSSAARMMVLSVAPLLSLAIFSLL